jgi:hypothetical protein
MGNATEMFYFDSNLTTAKKAWPSSTCLLYGSLLKEEARQIFRKIRPSPIL